MTRLIARVVARLLEILGKEPPARPGRIALRAARCHVADDLTRKYEKLRKNPERDLFSLFRITTIPPEFPLPTNNVNDRLDVI